VRPPRLPIRRPLQPRSSSSSRNIGGSGLSRRLRTYSPKAIIGIGYGCEPNFSRAHRAADVSAPLHMLPFPNWPSQRRQYVEELTALLMLFESSGFLMS